MGKQREARSIARTLLGENFDEELKRCREGWKAKKISVGYDALAGDAPDRVACDELEEQHKQIAAARKRQFGEWKHQKNTSKLNAIIIAELTAQRNTNLYLDSYQRDIFRGLGEKLREQGITHADMLEGGLDPETLSLAGSVRTVATMGTPSAAGDVDAVLDGWDEEAERERARREVAQKTLLEEKERAAAIEKERRELTERTRDEARKQREEAEQALAMQKQEAAARQKTLEAQRKAEEARQQELEAQRRAEEEARQKMLEAQLRAEEDARQQEREAQRKADEARQTELEAQRRADEAARQQALEAQRRAEEAARQQELEAQRKAEEDARQKALEAQRKAEEEARQKELEAQRKAEEEAKRAVSQPVSAPMPPTKAAPLPRRKQGIPAGQQARVPGGVHAAVREKGFTQEQPQPVSVVPPASLVSMSPAAPVGSVQQQADEEEGQQVRCCFCFWRKSNSGEEKPLLGANAYTPPHQ